MKSVIALLLTSVVFAQESVLETSEPTLIGQYAKWINEGARTELFVNSIAEWESGLTSNFTFATSGYSDAPATQSETQNKAFDKEFGVHFGELSENVTAYDGTGRCVDLGQALNKAVNVVNNFSDSQRVSLFYGPNCDKKAFHVWVAPWQNTSFTGDYFSSIAIDYGSL